MKLLLLLLVVLGVGYYYFFYREQPPAPKEPGVEVAKATPAPAAGKQGFDNLTALLRQDMSNIPAPLDGPGHTPTNAMSIKRRVGPYTNTRPEYRVLTQACDLIIQADAQRTAFQQACHAEQTRASFGESLNTTGLMDRSVPASHGGTLSVQTATPAIAAAAIHQRVEGNWANYRTHASEQVQTLLTALANKQL